MARSTYVVVAAVFLALAAMQASAQVRKVVMLKLPYGYKAIHPTIDNVTMQLHYEKHYNSYVSKLNVALQAAQSQPLMINRTLTNMLSSVGRTGILGLPSALQRPVRTQGGGAWNHALLFKTLTPTGSKEGKFEEFASPELKAAINSSFGGFVNMTKAIEAAAADVFGSGWVWLVPTRALFGKPLAVVTTANQDNTLMRLGLYDHEGSLPILGIDLWEHEYYLLYKNKRADFVSALLKSGNINWAQVSTNYAAALNATNPAKLEAAGAVIAQNF